MNYYVIAPPAKLVDYVQFFWVLEGTATIDKPFFHRIMAESSPEWIFYCKGQFGLHGATTGQMQTFLSALAGPTQNFKIVHTSSDFCLFGAYLFPYAIPGIFGLPAYVLSDQGIETGMLLGKEGQLLEQKMLGASGHRQRVAIISQFILHRLAKSRETNNPVFASIRQTLFSSAALSVSELAEDCFLSRRQFERKFLHYAGYSPKQFQKIARFNAVIKGFEKKPKSLTEVAYDCGYYDQSHFIHDFRLFSGYNPKAFFSQQKDAADYRAFEEFSL